MYRSIQKQTYCCLFFSLIFLFTACSPQSKSEKEPLSRTDFALGTVVTISLYDHQSEDVLDQALAKLNELEDTLSTNQSGTLVDTINASAGIAPVVVDAHTYEVIRVGLDYSALTDGAFDLTIGPLVKLWNIGFPEARVPSESEIAATLPSIDYHHVLLDPVGSTVYLTKPHMALDLGGIAKGYAADQLVTLLKDQGVEHAIIDLGGNIYTLGTKPSGDLWTVGVQDPFNPRGQIIGRLKVADQSVVTSGIYERYVEDASGKHYHHILNPRTGYPYDNDIAGVTLISEYSTDGDALSTAVFAMGVEKGLKYVESLDRIDAIFITTDSKVHVTSGIKDAFTLTNEDFTLSS